MKRAAIAVGLVLILGAGIGYVGTGGGFSSSSSSGSGAKPAVEPASGVASHLAFDAGDAVVGAPAKAAVDAPAETQTSGGGGGSGYVGSTVPAIGPEIVKTAQLSVEVKKDTFQTQFDAASLVAQKYGGFVESSSTAQGDDSESGTLLIRVPNANFEAAMSDLRGLGTTDSESSSGVDVSSQFVDLEARLRTWQAQEAVFLRLMHKANSINETLQIQRQLQDVQMQIEQIKGELQKLHDQTRMSTISVTIHEPGVAVPRPQPKGDTRPNLGEAWSRALDGLLGVVYTTVVGLGYLLPIGAIVLIGLMVWRRVSVRTAA
jgi:hypothetical protein